MNDDLLYFNGINGSTGDYLIPPLSPEALAGVARGESIPPDHLMELAWRKQLGEAHYGVKAGVDPRDLAQAGWGVIFASDADPRVRDALRELLDYRKEQANRHKELYREFSGQNGFRPNDTKNLFLARFRVGPGAADPDKMPYYLLIVGDPEKIPYTFQYQLDVAYAVGRIHFDTLDDYARYAHSVVQAEKQNQVLPRRAVLFSVENPDDHSTQLASEHLVKPLAEKLKSEQPDWQVETVLGGDATKGRLDHLMGGDDTPALLFTASHGLAFDLGDPRQSRHQGALVCRDWPGPAEGRGQPLSQNWYYASDDLAGDARVAGMIAFQFACFAAGTPRMDQFAHLRQGRREPVQIAPVSFVAQLPKRLLAHPAGGALAVIGHIDRAWGSSFYWGGSVEYQTAYESTVARIMAGDPVGCATEYFNARYAELAVMLNGELEQIRDGRQPNAAELSALWTANNDARGYAIIGDPAVRLRFANGTSTVPPGAESITLDAAPATPAPIAPAVSDLSATPARDTAGDAVHALPSDLAVEQSQLLDAIRQLSRRLEETTAALNELRVALDGFRKKEG